MGRWEEEGVGATLIGSRHLWFIGLFKEIKSRAILLAHLMLLPLALPFSEEYRYQICRQPEFIKSSSQRGLDACFIAENMVKFHKITA